MPRTARPWFRFYVEAMRDPKMRRLSPPQRWLWVAILAAARESCLPGFLFIAEGVPMSWGDLADYAGMKLREVEQGTDLMSDLRMLEFDHNVRAWFVPAWNDRQYESDNTTERTRKHRRRNVPTLLDGTPPETEADTEPEKDSRGEPFESDFDQLWKLYPRKVDKAAALVQYQARRRDGVTHAALLRSVESYAEASDGQERQYVKHGATFLGKRGSWVEWVDGPPADACRKPVATLEQLAEPSPLRAVPFVCTVGNPECRDGFIDTPSGAAECECRRQRVTA